MTSAPMLAALRDNIERLEAHGEAYAPRRVRLGHAEADASLQGGLALGAVHEVFAEAGRQSAVATGFVAGIAGRVAARRPVVWVRQDFTEVEAGALSMSGFAELGLDPRCLVSVRAADVEHRVADGCRRARLRCGGRRRAGSLGRGEAARPRRQPQADIGRASFRRHRPGVADGGGASAIDRRDPMDRARGAFAARLHTLGVRGARLCSTRSLSATVMALLGRWIMEWKCDECLFGEPAAYPQPVAAAPAHRSHQARQKPCRTKRLPGRVKKTRQVRFKNPALSLSGKTTCCGFLRSTMRRRDFGLVVGLPLANARAICPHVAGLSMPMRPPTPRR